MTATARGSRLRWQSCRGDLGAACMTGTRRARPSRQSGSAGQSARGGAPCCRAPSSPVVGRCGRIEIGRGDRLHPVGVGADLLEDSPHQTPPGGGTGVGHVEDARPAVEAQGDDRRSQVGGERRGTLLVVDEAKLAVPVGQAERSGHHVGAVGAADPAGAHDGGARPALALAGQLRGSVDRLPDWAGPIRGTAAATCRRRRSRSRRRPHAPRRARPPRTRSGSRCR